MKNLAESVSSCNILKQREETQYYRYRCDRKSCRKYQFLQKFSNKGKKHSIAGTDVMENLAESVSSCKILKQR